MKKLDATFDTGLVLTCRCCGQVSTFIVPHGDAVAVEAAYTDGAPFLSFQGADTAGELRTVNLPASDFRLVERAPLTREERETLHRRNA